MKKGFTLVELLATIIILGVIVAISFPVYKNLVKDNKNRLYQNQIETIKLASKKWATENTDLLPTKENEFINIKLLDLKKSGHLPIDIKNPITKKNFPNDMIIKIIYSKNDYIYEVLENSGTDLDSEPNLNGPQIVLNGEYRVTLNINDTYVEQGAKATKDGKIYNVDIIYELNGVQVSNIDTSKSNTYTVYYLASDGINTSKISRTVIIG